jgi:hypothetical protein
MPGLTVTKILYVYVRTLTERKGKRSENVTNVTEMHDFLRKVPFSSIPFDLVQFPIQGVY